MKQKYDRSVRMEYFLTETVKRTVYKILLIICLIPVIFSGCTAASADEMQTGQEERFVETSEDVGQEDPGMAGDGINGVDQAIAGAGKKETRKEHTAEETIKAVDRLIVTG